MPDYDLSLIDVALIDRQPNTLRLLRDVLFRLGLKRTVGFPGIGEATKALPATAFDLLLVDAEEADTEPFKFIRALRNDGITANPFLGLIVTTWQATNPLLLRVGNSGADGLLIKPVSPKQMLERIASLIESRRPFIVTSDYTGPDRRKSPREGAQVPLLDVPNTLRLKATRTGQPAQPRALIDRAAIAVNEQKLIRTSVQIAFLIEFALPGLSREPPEPSAIDHVGRVPEALDALRRRLSPGSPRFSFEPVAEALTGLVARIKAQPQAPLDRNALQQLRSLAYGAMKAAAPDRSPEVMATEVHETVARYRARLTQIAAGR